MVTVSEYLPYFESLGMKVGEDYLSLDIEKGYVELIPRLELSGPRTATDAGTKKEYSLGPGGMKVGTTFIPYIREINENPEDTPFLEKLSSGLEKLRHAI
jgi:hypothetical protein